ncbi:hypothetical protein LIER_37858 [Lithospermum erythrorhizon]|uniref:Integrase zinc-binding domain-containing protein n=1 Tax=Lithospermum erythrorhizon TaxID=34254 RepID=A0AAV3PT98_LITER
MYNEELYKKSWDGQLLSCVSQEDTPKILAVVHQGRCGSHIGGRSLAVKITQIGYFLPTLVKDAMNYVKRCEACQRMGSIQHQPTTQATPILNPMSFAMWGIDLVGKLSKTKGSLEYAVVAMDYFKHRFSPVYYPQCNEQVEVMNNILFKGIKKNMIQSESKKGVWVDELPMVLWSLRTTPSHATGETPFSLVYGSEVVLPAEARLPTYCPGTYELERMNGDSIPRTWHASNLTKYYV